VPSGDGLPPLPTPPPTYATVEVRHTRHRVHTAHAHDKERCVRGEGGDLLLEHELELLGGVGLLERAEPLLEFPQAVERGLVVQLRLLGLALSLHLHRLVRVYNN
jgi:hypothetical protein